MSDPSAADLRRSSTRDWLAMVPMLLGIFVGSLMMTAVVPALGPILADLGAGPATGVWIIDAYPLALAAFLVPAARAGDHLGRKRIMVLGLIGFALLNLFGGLAEHAIVLIVTRVLLGASEAMVLSSVVATIGVQYHARERVLAYGMWTATFGVGSALGPLAGGLVAEGPGWRWILFGCVPIAIVALVLALVLVRPSRTSVPPTWDPPSIVLSILSLSGIVYALQHAMTEPLPAAVTGTVAVVLAVVFVRRQRRSDDPFIDVRIFAVHDFSVAYVRILVSTAASAAVVYLVGVHLTRTRGLTPVAIGLELLPQAIAITIGGLAAPLALRWVTNRTATTIAVLLVTTGLVWAAFDPPLLALPLILVGAGNGAVGTLAATALFDSTTADQAGQVGAVQEVAFALGSGLGVAVFGSIAIAAAPNGYGVALGAAGVVALTAALVPLLRRRPRRA